MTCPNPRLHSRNLLTLLLVIAWGVAAGRAAENGQSLAELARAAKTQFRPLTAADVTNTGQQVLAALDRLEARLRLDGQNGQDWGRYLKLQQLRDELAREEPSPRVIAQVYQRFTAGHDGLWLIWFSDLRQALMRYLQMANSAAAANLEESYQQVLDQLAARLESYHARPTPEEAWQIGLTLRLLNDIGQAPGLIGQVRKRFDNPNLHVTVSRDLLARNLEGTVDNEIVPVRDCILGSTILGTGVVNGRRTLEFFPSEEFAVIDAVFRGATKTDTTAYNRSVRAYSNGVTRLAATKRLWLTDEGISEHPPRADARTSTQFKGLSAPCRLVERIAWRKAYQQKSEAEWIAARHAEAQLRDRVEQEGREPIGRLRTAYQEKFRRPLIEHAIFPEQLRFATTATTMRVTALQAAAHQLAARLAPPDVPEGDLVVRLHESMVTNSADSLLSGMTLREGSLRTLVSHWLERKPDEAEKDDDGEVAISFPAGMAPAAVAFADDGVSILIRGERIYKDGELISRRLKMVDITARYTIERSPGGIKLVRQGEVEVLPTGFKREEGKPLSTEVVLVRNALKANLDKVFPSERELGFELKDDRGTTAVMKPVEAHARDGWLLLAWKLGDQ